VPTTWTLLNEVGFPVDEGPELLGREVTAAVVPIETAGVVDVLTEAVEVVSDEVASVNAAARPILRRSL